jgi:hypothetical protein
MYVLVYAFGRGNLYKILQSVPTTSGWKYLPNLQNYTAAQVILVVMAGFFFLQDPDVQVGRKSAGAETSKWRTVRSGPMN